jgi:hypothetical protein
MRKRHVTRSQIDSFTLRNPTLSENCPLFQSRRLSRVYLPVWQFNDLHMSWLPDLPHASTLCGANVICTPPKSNHSRESYMCFGDTRFLVYIVFWRHYFLPEVHDFLLRFLVPVHLSQPQFVHSDQISEPSAKSLFFVLQYQTTCQDDPLSALKIQIDSLNDQLLKALFSSVRKHRGLEGDEYVITIRTIRVEMRQ